MIDPRVDCVEIARISGVWYHVNAAWGGTLTASDRLRGVLAGIGRADSLAIDAHKWFATTMGCGMFIARHAQVLSSAFQVSTSYMPSNIPNLDPYVTSVQWSRRFPDCLFLSLAAAGWTGYGEHLARSIELVGLLRERRGARAWSIANHAVLWKLRLGTARSSRLSTESLYPAAPGSRRRRSRAAGSSRRA
jgi:glutamate/tyrosine decarboxylase-like PLP-dependent enzyme